MSPRVARPPGWQRGEQTVWKDQDDAVLTFLSPQPPSKPISPWGGEISSQRWRTGTFSMDREHSLSEQEIPGKQCGK